MKVSIIDPATRKDPVTGKPKPTVLGEEDLRNLIILSHTKPAYTGSWHVQRLTQILEFLLNESLSKTSNQVE